MNQPHDELQRQLDDLLRQIEQRRRRRFWRPLEKGQRWLSGIWHRLTRYIRWPRSPSELMLISLATIVASAVLMPFLPAVGSTVGIVGVALFLLAFATSFIRPRQADQDMYWRGRLVSRRPIPWWERLYRLLYQRRWS